MNCIKLLIINCLLSISISLFSQITDDFSDGDFTQNPAWIGDTSLFVVAQQQLQLNATDAGDAYLATMQNMSISDVEWRFSIRLAFAPSQNNFAKIYLLADSANLRSRMLTGFYLQLGEMGSDDVIELFYQENGTSYSVFRGTTSIATAFFYKIKVTKSPEDLWTLYVDHRGNGLYEAEASAYASTIFAQERLNVMGIFCNYTASNKNKFFFDNFYFGAPIVDCQQPIVEQVVPHSENFEELMIYFSEIVTPATALDTSRYFVREILQNPTSCQFIDDDYRKVILTFPSSFTERQEYALHIDSIADFSGNILNDTLINYRFYRIKRNEVLISEIMADPTPAVQLPECEYIELYNTLPFDISLTDCVLSVGSNTKALPRLDFPAEGSILIIPNSCYSLFSDCNNCYPVTSLAITDDGQAIMLYDNRNEVLHYVQFSKTWHGSSQKQEGGWSLEMMDNKNPCGGKDNWGSSQDPRGGTPLEINSIIAHNQDVANPFLQKVVVMDSTHLRVYFNEMIIPDTFDLISLFAIDRNIQIVSVAESPPENRCFELTIAPPIVSHTIYTLTVQSGICDCVGNLSSSGEFARFGLSEQVLPFDVVINEILTDPFDDSDGDFIELYNRSKKIIDLADLKIAVGWDEEYNNAVTVVADGYLLFPEQYVAIAKNRDLTLSQYATSAPQNILGNSHLPAFPNEEGAIHLIDFAYGKIDKIVYNKDMHYPLLNSTDGVSLERIHFNMPTQDADNWKSASESVGWATPAYQNSQFSDSQQTEQTVEVIPEVFSPDGDGHDDYAEICCRFPEGENRITVIIYDRYGHVMKQLVNNQICGLIERFRWDGVTDDGRGALNDIYVVKIQIWNMLGNKKIIKKVVAITRRI